MIRAIVFSKDRPAQLDLLLRSIKVNAPWISPVTVIFHSPNSRMIDGYLTCAAEHPSVTFLREKVFREQVVRTLTDGWTTLLCDDDVFYRRVTASFVQQPLPHEILLAHPSVLCVSLRLGHNTTYCYSLRSEQMIRLAMPLDSGVFLWPWGNDCTGDYSYPGSCDGHVFRGHQLRRLLENTPNPWNSPNELEDALNRACQMSLLPLMASYPQSLLVGIPVNSTQTAYKPNRHSETHRAPVETLLNHYLKGKRLSLDSVVASEVDSAHREFKLLWQPETAKVPA